MATIIQQAITLTSRNQLRYADRLAREWAIAHAGSHKSQAANQLGGSLPFREWQNDTLTILSALQTDYGGLKHVQIYSVTYALPGGSEPYIAYIVTHCRSMQSRLEAIASQQPSYPMTWPAWKRHGGTTLSLARPGSIIWLHPPFPNGHGHTSPAAARRALPAWLICSAFTTTP